MRKIDGAKIAKLRKQKGWDQYELAQAAQIAPSVVSRLERNLQSDFKLSVLDAVATSLGVSIDSLLDARSELEIDTFSPELQIVFAKLHTQPQLIQRHVAGIIRGYLAALDEESP